jgi:predicted MFS family arabinose efflux permease
LKSILRQYARLPRSVLLLVTAGLLTNLIVAAAMLVWNLHLRALGHDDAFIARATSYRFIGVLLFAVPTGAWLRGRRLKPVMALGALTVPLTTFAMLWAADAGHDRWLFASFFVWGLGLMAVHVAALPFVVREAGAEHRAEALSLNFATWSISMVSFGLLAQLLSGLGSLSAFGRTLVLDEGGLLVVSAGLGLLAVPLILLIRESPEASRASGRRTPIEWPRVLRAVSPNVLISIGAGLTIPFINLFFNGVFGVSAASFSLLGAATGVLVFAAALLNPAIKRRFGYRTAILTSQSLSVAFLVTLASTEVFAGAAWALPVAMACFVLRQPLMNMAAPISTDLTMAYVGDDQREIASAITAGMWSGAWFVSAKIFEWLRAADVPYWQVFLITAVLYGAGIVAYAWLIRDHERREAARIQERA